MATGVFFGRFNIPHAGHVQVINQMAAECDRVIVYLSSSSRCLALESRLELLQALVRSNVEFRASASMHSGLREACAEFSDVVFYVGSDRMPDAVRMQGYFPIELREIERDPSAVSSTRIRGLIDANLSEDLLDIYGGNTTAVSMAMQLRTQELC